MKIIEITGEHIKFDNDKCITYDHEQDCCEYNYADFEQLDDLARAYDFDEQTLQFYFAEGSGFTFGDGGRLFFVPCYSDQNGYYTTDIIIYYDGEAVCCGECKMCADY